MVRLGGFQTVHKSTDKYRGKTMKKAFGIIGAFGREEDGVALTEYLILLALLVGGVIIAVTAAGDNLAAAWDTWGTFWNQLSYTG